MIILTILKLLGLLILALLGLILFLLLIVLFAPIGYKVQALWNEKSKNVKGHVSFLGPLLFVSFHYDQASKGNEFFYRFTILGFTLSSNDAKFIARKEKKANKKAYKDQKKSNKEKQESIPSTSMIESENTRKDPKNLPAIAEPEPKSSKPIKKQKQLKSPKKKFSLHRMKTSFCAIINKIKQFFKKGTDFKNQIQDFRINFSSTNLTILKQRLKKYIQYIFKHSKPTSIKGQIEYGFKDPALTGESLGILACFTPLYRMKLNIIPNFQEPCFSCNTKVKGRIHCCFFAYLAWQVYKDPYLRKTYDYFKRKI